MKNTKRVFKLFYIFNLDKEENWLREMANKGWFFQRVNWLGIYTFIKGPCKDTIYKIDFNNNIVDIEEYYDLFSQSGWKYINKIRCFKYFKYTGDASNYSSQVDIYNEPVEQLTWLRKYLMFFLTVYGFEFVVLYILLFLQNSTYSSFDWLVKLILAVIVILSFILVRFINSYIILKNKVKEKQYKDYYQGNALKKAYSRVSLFIFPVFICALLAVTLTFASTVGDSEKSIRSEILQHDKFSRYPMRIIDYIKIHDIDDYKVCLYGNDERIGMIALEELFFDRYKVITNFSGGFPSNQRIFMNDIILKNTKYLTIYGEDEKQEISKIILNYNDGTDEEITKDSLIRKDKYFFALHRLDKALVKVKVYAKDNVDVTDKYIPQ